jgi:hypothetical protein
MLASILCLAFDLTRDAKMCHLADIRQRGVFLPTGVVANTVELTTRICHVPEINLLLDVDIRSEILHFVDLFHHPERPTLVNLDLLSRFRWDYSIESTVLADI